MGNALDDARQMFANFQQGAGKVISNVGQGINNAVSNVSNFVRQNPTPASFVQSQAPSAMTAYNNFFQQSHNIADNVINQFKPAANFIKPIAQGVGQQLVQGAEGALKTTPPYQLYRSVTNPMTPQEQIGNAMGGLKTAFTVASPALMLGYQGGAGILKGAAQSIRTKTPLLPNIQNAIVNQPGAGTAAFGKGPLATAGNIAEFAAPFAGSAVKGVAALKGLQDVPGLTKAEANLADAQGFLENTISKLKSNIESPDRTNLINELITEAKRHVDVMGVPAKEMESFGKGNPEGLATALLQKATGFNSQRAQVSSMGGVSNLVGKPQGQIPPVSEAVQAPKTAETPIGGTEQGPGPLPWETQQEYGIRQGLANDKPEVKLPPEPGQKVPVPNINEVGAQARMAHFAESQKITTRGENLANIANMTLKGEDNNLFRTAMQHPDQLDELAAKSTNPGGFKNLAQAAGSFFDSVFKSTKDNKVKMGFVEDYFPHIWDLSKPEDQQTYNDLMRTSNYKAGFTKQKIFQFIEDGQDAGLKLKYPNVSQDIVAYAQSMSKQVGNQAMQNAANQMAPGSMVNMSVVGGVPPRDYMGRNYLQSPVKGQEGTFVSPDLAKQLTFYKQSALADNPVIKILDKANTTLKEVKLGGGLFHSYRETINYIGASIGQGHIPRIDESTRAFLDSNFWNNKLQDFTQRGVVDDASNMGITLSKVQDIGKYDENTMNLIQKNNPVDWLKKATFDRQINYMKLKLVSQLPENYKTPTVGKQIEALFNGVNNEVANTNKTLSQVGRFGVLAAQFNIGKLINIGKAAFTPSLTDPAANFARSAIVGTVLTTFLETELVRKVLTGNFSPDLKHAITDSILNPQVPLPYKSPTGKQLSMGIPGTDISDIASAIKDPSHFITARAGPLASLGNQIASGKDYYGNPLVNPYGPGGVKGAVSAVGQTAQAQLPIPVVQAIKTAQGKQNVPTALLNTAGFRVHTSEQDPGVIYAKTMQTVENGLNPNLQAEWNTLHPQKKDADGNPVYIKGSDNTSQAANIYLNDVSQGGKLVQAELNLAQKLKSQGIQTNPLWDLTPQQRSFVWLAQAHVPGQTNAYSKAIYNQPWYPQYQQNLTNYYSSFNTAQTPAQSTAGGLTAPQPSPEVQTMMNNKQFNNPQVQAYLQANTQYNNQRIQSMGGVPIPASSGGGSSSQAKSIKTKIKQMTSQGRHTFGQVKKSRTSIAKIKPMKKQKSLASIKSIKVPKMKQVSFKIPKQKLTFKTKSIKNKLPKFS